MQSHTFINKQVTGEEGIAAFFSYKKLARTRRANDLMSEFNDMAKTLGFVKPTNGIDPKRMRNHVLLVLAPYEKKYVAVVPHLTCAGGRHISLLSSILLVRVCIFCSNCCMSKGFTRSAFVFLSKFTPSVRVYKLC